MRTNTIRILALLLALCTALLVFAACGSTTTPDSEETKKSGQETSGEEGKETDKTESETKKYYEADIPEGTDLGREEFRILTWDDSSPTWYDCDFVADQYTGDTVSDAAYTRKKETEDMLNVVIVDSPDSSYGQVHNKLKATVDVGDDTYQLAIIPARECFKTLAQNGYLLDLNEIDDLHLENPWWDQNARDGLSMGGKLYAMAGDMSILYRKCLRVYYFNKQIHQDNNIENLYDLVDNMEWTIYKMVTISQMVSDDLNGDGAYDENDLYGLCATVDTITTGLIGAGVRYVNADPLGYPEFCFYDEKTQDVWDQYVDILFDKQCCVLNNCSDRGYNTSDMFQTNQFLFSNCELHNLAAFRKMPTNFGILPTPLYDEEQEDYYSTVNPVVCGLAVIPNTSTTVDHTTLILNVLGATSKNHLTPAYYDIYLQGQTARDEESTHSLEIVFNSVRWDICNIYDWGGIATFMQGLCRSYSTNFASTYAGLEAAAQTKLEETITAFEKLE